MRVPTSAAPAAPQAGPDLVIESITYTPLNPAIGQPTDITVTIKNQGDSAANGFYGYLFVDPTTAPPNATTPYNLRQGFFIPLSPGASFSFARTGLTFASSGNHPVFAWADRDGTLAESNEGNNLLGPVNINVPPAGGSPDSFEPDNACAQAKPISTDGTQQSRNLNPSPDTDWVKFTAVSGQRYTMKGFVDGPDADLEFALYNNCSSPGSFGSDVDFVAPADGDYFVKITHSQTTYGSNNAYRVQVTTPSSCTAVYEPNNICAAAGDLAVNGTAQTHSFCEAGDTDWTKFPTAAGATYFISSTNLGVQADVELSLFSTCGSASSTSTGQTISFTAASAGYAYLRAENHPTTTAGVATSYAVQVTQGAVGCTQDSFENDNTTATASTLAINNAQTNHNACPLGDVDWVKFTATEGTTYTLETGNLGASADTVLCLYDASGTTQLVCDDDNGAGNASRLIWRAPNSGNYFLKIRDYDAQVSGSETKYDLSISTALCAADSAENDNARADAKSITVGAEAQHHNICGAGDEDWVSFAATPGPYHAQAISVGADADTMLELYDSNNTKLSSNDDFEAGTSARVVYTFTVGGTYFVRARHYNPIRNGQGTEYDLQVKTGLPIIPPNQQPPPPDQQQPPPSITGTQTLILVNLARFSSVYGAPASSQLYTKLTALASHSVVSGEVIRLENNTDVAAAYTTWLADIGSVEKANLVTAAIRRVVLNYLASHGGVQYIVLVGDDTMLPMRRVVDNTPRLDFLERDYTDVNSSHPTGAAIRGNNYMTDDYYADREPTPFTNRELYIPDLAVGRLIETPTDIQGSIDNFLASPTKVAGNVLVTGYDFVQDSGNVICQHWRDDFNTQSSPVNCTLIGSAWPLADYKTAQLATSFDVQAINGHANHFAEGAPGAGQSIVAADIIAASTDFVGDLIYTMGCHSGLNVPSNETNHPLDLAEAFIRRGASYVGNTGFGWGLRGAIGLSETMMKLYTEELRRDASARMGQALTRAKQRYYQQTQSFNGYDEKVMQQLIFYGLPMFELQTGASLGPSDENPFPSVELVNPAPLPGNFGDSTITSSTLALNLRNAPAAASSGDGSAYYIDGSASGRAGDPVQPLFFGALGESSTSGPARSAVFLGGTFTVAHHFDPVVASPYNEYVLQPAEATLDKPNAWYPDHILAVRVVSDSATIVAELGQFQPASGDQHVFNSVTADVYYSALSDVSLPVVKVIDALYNPQSNVVQVKVGAQDASGVRRVIVSYAESNGTSGVWKSVNLQFNAATQKWTGSFPGNANTRYFVQVVDNAANNTVATNKSTYFTPSPSSEVQIVGNLRMYMPTLQR